MPRKRTPRSEHNVNNILALHAALVPGRRLDVDYQFGNLELAIASMFDVPLVYTRLEVNGNLISGAMFS